MPSRGGDGEQPRAIRPTKAVGEPRARADMRAHHDVVFQLGEVAAHARIRALLEDSCDAVPGEEAHVLAQHPIVRKGGEVIAKVGDVVPDPCSVGDERPCLNVTLEGRIVWMSKRAAKVALDCAQTDYDVGPWLG